MDRLKEAFLALVGAAVPRIDYFTTYRCKVVKQSADGSKVDLKPDDSRIPQCSDILIKWGPPGITALITVGCFMHLGWENGDPGRPYACFAEGSHVTKLVLEADQVYVSGEAGAKKLATEDHVHTVSVIQGVGSPTTLTTATPTGVGGLTTQTSAK